MTVNLPPVPVQQPGAHIQTWLADLQTWFEAVREILQEVDRPAPDPELVELTRQVHVIVAANSELERKIKGRLCGCCGHIDGICPTCSMPHHREAEGGCELCVKHDDVPPAFSGETVMELALCESTLLEEIADSTMKRNDVAKTYALALKSSECDSVDWTKVNLAIIARWSPHALKWIKERAWSGRCFESGEPS